MGSFATVCVIILIIVLWGYIDFHIGKYIHRKRWKTREYPIRDGKLELITNGSDLYQAYFSDLQAATSTIHILFYIVKNDRFSQAFFEALKKQAIKGVKVRLLLDWFGGRSVPKQWIKEARAVGIHIAYCHKPRLPFLMFSLQQRNHRKITIIDGQVGYLGGYNIGKEYIDLDPELSPWRDYHVRLIGEAVADLEQEFLMDWERATGDAFQIIQPSPSRFDMEHRLYPSEGVDVENMLIQLIEKAKTSLVIGTPYFIPPRRLFSAIEAAMDRGVNVTVLVPNKSDHPLVKEASFRYLRRILAKDGIVYQFENGFFHAKVIVIDGKICDIGTANFDYRSILLNHEINCFIYERAFIAEVEAALAEDIRHSTRLKLENLYSLPLGARWKEGISYIIKGLL
ncbi:cardiolipin synthase [Bacillus sp. FJAT-50079]|uniref:cardiolipin synthase n=1 Tax=Bacillus sp. FJAT-50079 TaxID=2833577 RepID=UPI001BCA074D|nr:cardiolipin synthase [Bacillus sp. FJAT-50079]MBS4206829.1 cardiolipin synthase [Bacillus sp. FJAT-50079]